jgi:hypothetical protein
LKRASSRQRKRGSSSSASNEPGSSPSLRATPKRSSARADSEASASSLHQRGHAASIAVSAMPRSFSRVRSCAALSMVVPRCLLGQARDGRRRRSVRRVLLHVARNRPTSGALPRSGWPGRRSLGQSPPEYNCIAGGRPHLSAAVDGAGFAKPLPD